jgi:hypothetical protein
VQCREVVVRQREDRPPVDAGVPVQVAQAALPSGAGRARSGATGPRPSGRRSSRCRGGEPVGVVARCSPRPPRPRSSPPRSWGRLRYRTPQSRC